MKSSRISFGRVAAFASVLLGAAWPVFADGALYYYEELTLKEIGSILGVSESRISQIHTKAVMRLRTKLRSQMNSLVAGLMGPGIPQEFSTAEKKGARAVIGDIAKILAQ